MPFFFPRVQQLEEENTDLRTTVTRLKSQTEKLDEVSSRSQQDAGFVEVMAVRAGSQSQEH